MLLLQAVVAVAPLGEGREGRSMAAHVERSGRNTHYTHDPATCAACQARTLQGAMALVPPVLPVDPRHESLAVAPLTLAVPSGPHALPKSRAPPALA